MGTDRDGSGIPLRMVIGALVVLGGVFYVQQRPYVGFRPPVTELRAIQPGRLPGCRRSALGGSLHRGQALA